MLQYEKTKNILKNKIVKYSYWLMFLVILYLFIRFELKFINVLQIISDEPLLSCDITLDIDRGNKLHEKKFFRLERQSNPPIFCLNIMGERFPFQFMDYSIGYIPGLILKISWKLCEDIICNRIASLITSVIYVTLTSVILLRIYGFFAAMLGTWLSIMLMGYIVQPSNSEMIIVTTCFSACVLTFWNLYLHHKTGEKKYFTRAIVSSLFSINFNTFWGLIINFCTFTGFCSRKLFGALKLITLKEILKILILFIILTFPLFITSFFVDAKGQSKYHITLMSLPQHVNFNLDNLKTVWQNIKFFFPMQFINVFYVFLLLCTIIIYVFSYEYRRNINNKATALSSILYFVLIISILTLLSRSISPSSTDIFLRITKYMGFYGPFLLSSLISFFQIHLKSFSQKVEMILKVPILFAILLISNKLFNTSFNFETIIQHIEEREKIDPTIAKNFEILFSKNFVPLWTQRELAKYLLEQSIYSPYAIVPNISSIGFIDALSKDVVKAWYIPCSEEISDINIKKWLALAELIRRRKSDIFVIENSCKDKISLSKYHMELIHEIKEKDKGQTIYYIFRLVDKEDKP